MKVETILKYFFHSHYQRLLPGCMSPTVEYSSKLFAFTADGHLMLSCGYWDNSIRLVNTDRGKDKLKSCVTYHNGNYIQTLMTLITKISKDEDYSKVDSLIISNLQGLRLFVRYRESLS